MAGLRGNQAYWGWGKQSVKGTAAPVAFKTPFSGGNIAPTRSIAQLSETDTSRDEGVSYVEQTAIEGSPEMYVRDSNLHSLFDLALGGTVTTGGPTNYSHAATPANTLPYATFYKMLGGLLYESYEDCLVSELTISADTGGALTAAISLVGRKAVRLAAEPDALVIPSSTSVFNFNEATVLRDYVGTSLISNFELTFSNNVTAQQTDSAIPYDVVPGQRSVTVGYDMIFDDLTAYNTFHYGSGAGTTQTDAINTTPLTFLFTKGAETVSFSIPNAAVEEFPVEPDPGGDPVVASVRTRAQRVVGTPVITSVITNAKTTVLL
jgi:hypothetical protein